MNTKSKGSEESFISRRFILAFLLATAVRFYANVFTFIINSDGILYIYQAQVLQSGDLSGLTCGTSYISNLPFLIFAFFKIFNDWAIAAKSVSFIFGTLTIIPIYFLFKHFFDENISLLGVLIYALIPDFVDRSADVLRDPVGWFFLVTGLLFFIKSQDKYSRLKIVLSSFFFILASWARIENGLYILVSIIFLLFTKEKRIEKSAIFLAPAFALGIVFLLNFSAFGVSVDIFIRKELILEKLTGPLVSYKLLDNALSNLHYSLIDTSTPLPYFLPYARNCIWLIGLGTILNHFLEGVFYPYALFFFIGIGGVRKRILNDRLILYLCTLTILSLILIYMHLLSKWIMDSRFLAILVFPSFIFAGFGLIKAKNFFKTRYNVKESVTIAAICFIILFSGLAKNLHHKEKDKIVFKQIGDRVARLENSDQMIKILTSIEITRWLTFYSNINSNQPVCPDASGYAIATQNNYADFFPYIKKHKIQYFLWNERFWTNDVLEIIDNKYSQQFKKIGSWYHNDTGKLILFKVIL